MILGPPGLEVRIESVVAAHFEAVKSEFVVEVKEAAALAATGVVAVGCVEMLFESSLPLPLVRVVSKRPYRRQNNLKNYAHRD